MKQTIKQRLINLLKSGQIEKFNRYRKFTNYVKIDLTEADLRWVNLTRADLTGADLDFSVLFFGCKSLAPKTDEKQRIQLAFHFLSWIKNSDNATNAEIEIYNRVLSYANRFHRDDVEKLEVICTKK